MHPFNNFGMWTVNQKSEECVTSYELNIKLKCVAPLLLCDIKNFLIPPRIYQTIDHIGMIKRTTECQRFVVYYTLLPPSLML